MVQLTKNTAPEILREHAAKWTDEYARLVAGDGTVADAAARRYAHPAVKDSLEAETCGKCAYCEAKIAHIDYPHIEHILPKVHRPDLICEWSNLTLGCTVCNTEKGDYHATDCALIHPYEDRIAEHLSFYGPMLVHTSPDRGRVTIRVLKLNRNAVLARRKEAIEQAQRALELVQRAEPGPVRAAMEAELEGLMDPCAEFSAAIRMFVNDSRRRDPGASNQG